MTVFQQLASPEFYEPTAIGLLGLVANLLLKRANPLDKTVTGHWGRVFTDRARTLTLAALSHLVLCIMAFRMGQLNELAALTAGYFNQELLTMVMENAKARQVARLNGDPPPSKGDA